MNRELRGRRIDALREIVRRIGGFSLGFSGARNERWAMTNRRFREHLYATARRELRSFVHRFVISNAAMVPD